MLLKQATLTFEVDEQIAEAANQCLTRDNQALAWPCGIKYEETSFTIAGPTAAVATLFSRLCASLAFGSLVSTSAISSLRQATSLIFSDCQPIVLEVPGCSDLVLLASTNQRDTAFLLWTSFRPRHFIALFLRTAGSTGAPFCLVSVRTLAIFQEGLSKLDLPTVQAAIKDICSRQGITRLITGRDNVPFPDLPIETINHEAFITTVPEAEFSHIWPFIAGIEVYK